MGTGAQRKKRQRAIADAQARKDFGDLIRRARRDRGLTLIDVALVADVHFGTLSKIECGTKDASEWLIHRLAKILKIPIDDAMTAAGRIPSDVSQWILSTPGCLTRLRREMEAA